MDGWIFDNDGCEPLLVQGGNCPNQSFRNDFQRRLQESSYDLAFERIGVHGSSSAGAEKSPETTSNFRPHLILVQPAILCSLKGLLF